MPRKTSTKKTKPNSGAKLPPGYPMPLDYQPFADFREKIDVTIRRVGKTQRPTVITRNGRPSVVLISPETFTKFEEDRESIEVMRAVRRGREEFAKGKCMTLDEAAHWLRARQAQRIAAGRTRKSA